MVEVWEHFCDPAYFDMWAVRRTGERDFRKSFHVPSQAEAAALADILTSLEKVKEEALSPELSDVEAEAALTGESIYVWGPDGDKFARMFAAAMKVRAAFTTKEGE